MLLDKSILRLKQSSVLSLQVRKKFDFSSFRDFWRTEEPPLVKPDPEDPKPNPKRSLKQWRKFNEDSNAQSSIFTMFSAGQTNTFPKFVSRGQMPDPNNINLWWENKKLQSLDADQQYYPGRHQTLGNDLAVTHFVLFREGKVRKLGDTKFLTMDDLPDVPSSYSPDWFIDAIDFSNTEVSYKGLENYRGLRYLKKMYFRNCPHFDDWCLERIIATCPTLEYLDISECKNVSERGLEGIYRSWNLKELVITDFHQNPAFELTCVMVEDCMPDLKITRCLAAYDDIIEEFH